MGLIEQDTRSKLIDPVLHQRGWTEELIKREETPGTIEIVEGEPHRQNKGRVDYTLRLQVSPDMQPVAVALIEAKKENLPANHGLEQVKRYAKVLNVPFLFSSNGHLFVEYDRLTGLTSQSRPLAEFPTPHDLRSRYEQHLGFSLANAVARPLLTRYRGGEATRRYYQDAAIRATLEKIARCQTQGLVKRALLSLATGAGKTFIAVNILSRIADAGQLRRALFVCDRDELRSQAAAALQIIFGADAATVSAGDPKKNARILIATYQTLDKERLASKLVETVPNLTDFRRIWVNREERRQVIAQLPDGERSPLLVRTVEDLEDCDLYDVLAELGYGLNRRTRVERVEAFAYKHLGWLNEMFAPTAATVKALTAQFTRAGTEGLENSKIFQTPEVRKAGD